MTDISGRQRLIRLVRKIFCGAVVCLGAYYVYLGLDLLPPEPSLEADNTNIEIVFEEVPEDDAETRQLRLSFEEYCKRNPISTCWDNRQTTDFLYDDDNEQIAIIKSEEFSPELLEKAMQASPKEINRVAEMLEDKKDLQVDEKTKELISALQDLNQNILDQLYEEELPEDVLEARPISNPKLIGKSIIPAHKPPYFGENPVIAVVIDDMGISAKRTADIASLKAPLTVSFLTYGRNLDKQIENSRLSGQEIMIHVPMEAHSVVDEAPDVLTTQMSQQEIQQNLLAMLGKFHDAKGINNHMGSKLTEDMKRMSAVMDVLKEKGLFFLDSKTSAKSKAEEAAEKAGIAYAHRHVFIDNNNDKAYILGQLAKAENVARKNGYAIAIGHPKTQTFAALKDWLPSLEEKGIVLMPLSKIVAILNPGK